jgi:hypothetical protein
MHGGGAKRASFKKNSNPGQIQNMFQIWAKNKKFSRDREGYEAARARCEESRTDASPRKVVEDRRMCAHREKGSVGELHLDEGVGGGHCNTLGVIA